MFADHSICGRLWRRLKRPLRRKGGREGASGLLILRHCRNVDRYGLAPDSISVRMERTGRLHSSTSLFDRRRMSLGLVSAPSSSSWTASSSMSGSWGTSWTRTKGEYNPLVRLCSLRIVPATGEPLSGPYAHPHPLTANKTIAARRLLRYMLQIQNLPPVRRPVVTRG